MGSDLSMSVRVHSFRNRLCHLKPLVTLVSLSYINAPMTCQATSRIDRPLLAWTTRLGLDSPRAPGLVLAGGGRVRAPGHVLRGLDSPRVPGLVFAADEGKGNDPAKGKGMTDPGKGKKGNNSGQRQGHDRPCQRQGQRQWAKARA